LTGLGRLLCIETGDDISKVSLELLGLRHHLPGGHVVLPSGAGSIIHSLAKDINQSKIKLKVKQIDTTPDIINQQ